MIDFEKIYEGWKNHLFPSSYLKEIIKKVSKERMFICAECEHNSKLHKSIRPDEHCIICGCTLIAKTKCLSSDCADSPPRWKALITEEEEEIITENTNEETSFH